MGVRLGYVASQPQYAEHLRPIWERSPGPFGRKPEGDVDRWLVCSTVDLRKGADIYMEHGVGLAWHRRDDLANIAKTQVLAPNEFIANRYRQADIPATVIGTPKLDAMLRYTKGGAIAVGFHWTSTAYSHILADYEEALVALASRYKVIGHGHPRGWRRLLPYYKALGIEPVADFRDVIRRSRLWVCDHSSTLYEYAALGRPVVLLRGPTRKPFESTGLRYDSYTGIGAHANPTDLVEVVQHTLHQPLEHAMFRMEATAALFPYLGKSVNRVLDVLEGT